MLLAVEEDGEDDEPHHEANGPKTPHSPPPISPPLGVGIGGYSSQVSTNIGIKTSIEMSNLNTNDELRKMEGDFTNTSVSNDINSNDQSMKQNPTKSINKDTTKIKSVEFVTTIDNRQNKTTDPSLPVEGDLVILTTEGTQTKNTNNTPVKDVITNVKVGTTENKLETLVEKDNTLIPSSLPEDGRSLSATIPSEVNYDVKTNEEIGKS